MEGPQALLTAYEERLALQSWEAVRDLIDEDAVFIFSEGTYRGKPAIEKAFRKTFALIKNETYRMSELSWVVETEDTAACEFEFQWTGLIDGKEASGGGRGSSVLRQTKMGEWRITLEHLGPAAHPQVDILGID
ncbi:MAG: DUF4440 domain-containing protein [Verrucomicrobiota bacterium]